MVTRLPTSSCCSVVNRVRYGTATACAAPAVTDGSPVDDHNEPSTSSARRGSSHRKRGTLAAWRHRCMGQRLLTARVISEVSPAPRCRQPLSRAIPAPPRPPSTRSPPTSPARFRRRTPNTEAPLGDPRRTPSTGWPRSPTAEPASPRAGASEFTPSRFTYDTGCAASVRVTTMSSPVRQDNDTTELPSPKPSRRG